MNIDQFIKTKPDELRLGQHFYNCYLHRLGWQDKMHHDTQELYNTRQRWRALELIERIMRDYQWTELPDLERTEGVGGYWRIKQ